MRAAYCTGYILVMHEQSLGWANDAGCGSCPCLCHQLCLEILLTCVCVHANLAIQPVGVDHCLAQTITHHWSVNQSFSVVL